MTAKLRLIVFVVLAAVTGVFHAVASASLNSIILSQNYSSQYSQYPTDAVETGTSKMHLTVTPGAVWDLKVLDGGSAFYLYSTSLWIGGILGGDTLVSTGLITDLTPPDNAFTYGELYPAGYPDSSRSIYPLSVPGLTSYQVILDDEERAHMMPTQNDFFRHRHIPLHLGVSFRAHISNEFPFKGICLLDFTIRNQGTATIRNAWVGVEFDGDIGPDLTYTGWDDDLAGSLRDIHTAYFIDNEGDVVGTSDNPIIQYPDAIALRPLYSSQPATDTNFNWWENSVYDAHVDFGPRLRGTPQDPFRDYNSGTYGVPDGDVNRYYLLRHREWDFDQVMSDVIGTNDPVWNTPPDWVNLRAVSLGADTRAVLSIGPFELAPDSSLRVIYALFVGDLVHVDWRNNHNLVNADYQQFYSNLNFKMLRRTADDAVSLVRQLVDPRRPPLSFAADSVHADSAWLSWEPTCLPEVTDYALYLSPATREELLNPATVLPVAEEHDWRGATRILVSGGRYDTLITGLEPGRPYIAALAHVTVDGEGTKSDPIVIGTSNQSLVPAPPVFDRQFLHYSKSDSRVTISWQPSPDAHVSYYKIYKTDDSALAANKYHPFWTDDSAVVPFAPAYRARTPEGTYWYYELRPRDSVSSSVTQYVDTVPDSTAFYWVSAVTKPGFESEFSSTLQVEPVPPVARDILLVFGTPLSDDDYILTQNVRRHLEDILGNYVFDIYNWTDTNYFSGPCPDGYCVDWSDLAKYRLVLFQEYPQPKILPKATSPAHRLLTRLMESGRRVAYFGIPPGKRIIAMNRPDTLLIYDSASFESREMGIDSLSLQSWPAKYDVFGAIDTLAGFNGADPAAPGWPGLSIGTVNDKVRGFFKLIFTVDSVLPLVPAVFPDTNARVVYSYRSGFPATSRLRGLPCGVAASDNGDTLFTFTFPLWSLDLESGAALIDRLIDGIPTRPSQSPAHTQNIPASFSLYANYPNPFNSSTVISFELFKARRVSLDLFNVLGARIRTLIGEQSLPPGVHSVTWNGVNDDGQPVASGVYFYRLHTDAGDATRRLILIK